MISSKLKRLIYLNVIDKNNITYLKNTLRRRDHRIRRKDALVFTLHNAVERDQIRLCEEILGLCSDEGEALDILNSSSGRHGYMPICRAAYNLSIKTLKFLALKGSNISRDWKNKHDEDIYDVINLGFKQKLEENPSCEIFLKQNRDSCVDFMNRYFDR